MALMSSANVVACSASSGGIVEVDAVFFQDLVERFIDGAPVGSPFLYGYHQACAAGAESKKQIMAASSTTPTTKILVRTFVIFMVLVQISAGEVALDAVQVAQRRASGLQTARMSILPHRHVERVVVVGVLDLDPHGLDRSP
jgi:hypothetical protein